MKTFPKQLLIVAVSILITACGEGISTRQAQKDFIDKILKGEPVLLSKFPKTDAGTTYDLEILARRLGYSESDIKKLNSMVIKAQQPEQPQPEKL